MSDSPEVFPDGAEGKAIFKYGQEEFFTWYTVYGDLKSSTRTPLVILNGGPGCSYHYLLSCYDLYTKYQIPLVFYDQLGASNSYKPEWKLEDKPKSFWSNELHIDELLNLVRHLEIDDRFGLLGHSWGAMMAAKTAAQRQPKGLRSIVLASGTPSMPLFVEETRKLINNLPAEHRDAILKHEADGTTDHPDYMTAKEFFYAKHVCRLAVLPEMMFKTDEKLKENGVVYHAM